jgi:hypothetical protein
MVRRRAFSRSGHRTLDVGRRLEMTPASAADHRPAIFGRLSGKHATAR